MFLCQQSTLLLVTFSEPVSFAHCTGLPDSSHAMLVPSRCTAGKDRIGLWSGVKCLSKVLCGEDPLDIECRWAAFSQPVTMNFDVLETATSREQRALEEKVSSLFVRSREESHSLVLNRALHVKYLHGGLKSLPAGFISLEAARPWILYWITHALALLEAPLPPDVTIAGSSMALTSVTAPLSS